MSKKGENLLIWKNHVTMITRDTYKSNQCRSKSFSNFLSQKQSTSFSYQHSNSFTHDLQHYCFLGQSNLYRLCGLGKRQDRFGQISWSKNDSNYLDVKLKEFRKDDKKEFRLVQNFTIGEADFNQFMRLTNQLVNAAVNFAREETLTPVLIPTMSRDIDEHFKLAHKVVDVVDRSNRKICVTLLRYNVDKPESSFAQDHLFARKKEDEKFQQVVYVKYKLEEFIYLLDVMNSVYDNVITNQHICNVL